MVEQLSSGRHKLRIRISNTKEGPKKCELKTERNFILNKIHKLVKRNKERELKHQTAEIETLKDNAKIYGAVKILTSKKSDIGSHLQGRRTRNSAIRSC